jgi:hypothetical protein
VQLVERDHVASGGKCIGPMEATVKSTESLSIGAKQCNLRWLKDFEITHTRVSETCQCMARI